MRITRRVLDSKTNESYVREIEMLVDAVLDNHPYTIQFWKDVELYGLKEALAYLDNQLESKGSAIKANTADHIKLVSRCMEIMATFK